MKTYKEIFTEWHNEFPFLKQYSPSTLFQKVGPMLIGLRIEQPWEEIYRVILEAIPLWKTERKDFGNTILYDPLLNKKGGQVLTTFRHHDLDFKEALEDAKKLYGLVLTPSIPLNDVVFLYVIWKYHTLCFLFILELPWCPWQPTDFSPAKRKESKSNDIPRNKVISSVNFTFFNSFKVIEMQN